MPYTPTIWVDEVPATSPIKYKITQTTDGDVAANAKIEVVTGITAGTPVNATNLNKLETGVQTAQAAAESAATSATAAIPKSLVTTVGDLIYATASATLARLAKPALDSILKMTSAGTPSWLPVTQISGLLHTKNKIDFAPGQTFASTWADITGATFNLTLTHTCTIVVRAVVTGYNANAGTGRGFYYRAVVDGVADASASIPFEGSQTEVINRTLAYEYYATGIPAGTRTVKLQCQADTDSNIVTRGRLVALAFVE